MNEEIKKLHGRLIANHRSLAKRLGKTKDHDEAEAILREMEELNFRVMMAGHLLFKETTEALDSQVAIIIDASADLDQAIKDIEKVKDLIKAIGKFLTLADKALDALKLL
jgi:pentatricopeptide repeat protein